MDEGTRATIPIFPLAAVVLFPRLRVPLYIFEPRYRQMTKRVLEGDGRIGMVTVRPEHIPETAGDPPVFSTGCAGKIIHSEALRDGGYNIVLEGTQRFQIRSESLPRNERLYRMAEVELLVEAPAQDPLQNCEARDTIRELLRDLLRDTAHRSHGSESSTELFDAGDDELFVNSLAQSLNFSAAEKQGLIECNGVADRLEQLMALLQFRLAASRSGQSGEALLQ